MAGLVYFGKHTADIFTIIARLIVRLIARLIAICGYCDGATKCIGRRRCLQIVQ